MLQLVIVWLVLTAGCAHVSPWAVDFEPPSEGNLGKNAEPEISAEYADSNFAYASEDAELDTPSPGRPKLRMSISIQDQNGDRCFQPYEQVVLHIEIQNQGTAVAKTVEINVSAHPAFVRTLGKKETVSEIMPGWKEKVVMTGILPEELPNGRAYLKVSVNHALGPIDPIVERLVVVMGADLCGGSSRKRIRPSKP